MAVIFEDDFRAQLLTLTGLTDIVGNRVYFIVAPEDLALYPCVTFAVASHVEPEYVFEGSISFCEDRVVVTAWSLSFEQVAGCAKAVRTALSGFRGALPLGTQVPLIRVANAQSFRDPNSKLYRYSVHLLVQYAGN